MEAPSAHETFTLCVKFDCKIARLISYQNLSINWFWTLYILNQYQLALFQIDSLRKDGKFVGVDGTIPEGQGIVMAHLNECHELLEMVIYSLKPIPSSTHVIALLLLAKGVYGWWWWRWLLWRRRRWRRNRSCGWRLSEIHAHAMSYWFYEIETAMVPGCRGQLNPCNLCGFDICVLQVILYHVSLLYYLTVLAQ